MIAYQMITQAVKLYRKQRGLFPTRIGLDYFTRHGEYTGRYGDWYVFWDYHFIDVSAPPSSTITQRAINILPYIFEKVEIPPPGRRMIPPKFGREEVYLNRGTIGEESMVLSIWFPNKGQYTDYHAIIWEREK